MSEPSSPSKPESPKAHFLGKTIQSEKSVPKLTDSPVSPNGLVQTETVQSEYEPGSSKQTDSPVSPNGFVQKDTLYPEYEERASKLTNSPVTPVSPSGKIFLSKRMMSSDDGKVVTTLIKRFSQPLSPSGELLIQKATSKSDDIVLDRPIKSLSPLSANPDVEFVKTRRRSKSEQGLMLRFDNDNAEAESEEESSAGPCISEEFDNLMHYFSYVLSKREEAKSEDSDGQMQYIYEEFLKVIEQCQNSRLVLEEKMQIMENISKVKTLLDEESEKTRKKREELLLGRSESDLDQSEDTSLLVEASGSFLQDSGESFSEEIPTEFGAGDTTSIATTAIVDLIPPESPGSAVPISPNDSYFPSEKRSCGEHILITKFFAPKICTVCGSRIPFTSKAAKCEVCKIHCHVRCSRKLPPNCEPVIKSYNKRKMLETIDKYAPKTPPMIPALLLHCVNEIELRGFTEVGVYRVSGNASQVRALQNKFLKGKTPSLNRIHIHVVCETVKIFLRSLREPLVTYALWKQFVQASQMKDFIDSQNAFHQVIFELPQSNRDTLAYMILHLRKVAETKECQMDINNLATIFGPTIVGYSCENPTTCAIFDDTAKQNTVMKTLLKIPDEYWSTLIDVEKTKNPPKLKQSSSTDYILSRALLEAMVYAPMYM